MTRGRAQPLGATPEPDGVNFSLYAEHATGVELLLFDSAESVRPARTIVLSPELNRTHQFWHCHVAGLRPGQHYAYRVSGPTAGERPGARFDPDKVLLDPYARANDNTLWDRTAAIGPGDNTARSMRSVVVDLDDYDWEGDEPLRTPLADTVIYEVHVGGFTRSPTSGVSAPGTFAGLVEKIPHLVELGVTAVELLPVFDFDETQVLRTSPGGTPLRNYWGYDPFGFFAPHSGYCATTDPARRVDEFRDMVKKLHRAGIEVILDVVYNHTSEGNERGPTIGFRGIANETYYHLSPQDPRYYLDYTGCGNSVNANHLVVVKMILESLEFWVTRMHVDGFRFDLATELTRGADGAELAEPPVLSLIELSAALDDIKIIAEPWDASGGYQVGRFPGHRWCEWNGPYRDDVRRFVRGDGGVVGALASRVAGSADIFATAGGSPLTSINFITAHDGFTLNDLVGYDHKHNEANGENNRDGTDDNLSWNCGHEGPVDDVVVERLRVRQIKNFAAVLLLSRGVPMLLGGDEFRRTQWGNNNAYCLDDPTTWFDWSLRETNAEVFRFFREMIALRKRTSALRAPRFYGDRRNERGLLEISWHGTELGKPGWLDPDARALAFTIAGFDGEPDLHVMLNMYHLDLVFEVPEVPGADWGQCVDTALPAPFDIRPPDALEPFRENSYRVQGHSSAILVSMPQGGRGA
ncbi:glycogen debranching protein GlgX [Actinosynnema sp. CS-041913]|uniref:glycogen debranching protein GlgX n=1 Tax=Actinosynnema sp. CS-041913 TaxID=3239917 RepID=UPI003D91EEBD